MIMSRTRDSYYHDATTELLWCMKKQRVWFGGSLAMLVFTAWMTTTAIVPRLLAVSQQPIVDQQQEAPFHFSSPIVVNPDQAIVESDDRQKQPLVPSLKTVEGKISSDEQNNQPAIVMTNVDRDVKDKRNATPATATTTGLPSCFDLMRQANSPHADGGVLTYEGTPVTWKPRADGSRELQLKKVCELKRYSHAEAQQCLEGTNMLWIGDSLTRFQVVSLAHFLEHKRWPARFGTQDRYDNGTCWHVDESGQPTCDDSSSICKQFEFETNFDYHRARGDMDGLFHGHLQCHCSKKTAGSLNFTDSMHYVSQPAPTEQQQQQPIHLTSFMEFGKGETPLNITGRPFDDCASKGNCRHNASYAEDLIERLQNRTLEINGPLEELLTSGTLRRYLPKDADFVIYNRGLWGPLPPERANRVLPLLRNLVTDNNKQGRCFYRSTTCGSVKQNKKKEREETMMREKVRQATWDAGCGHLDFHHITEELGKLGQKEPAHPRNNIYWDNLHFQPWVYEEFNNLLLNVLCNKNG